MLIASTQLKRRHSKLNSFFVSVYTKLKISEKKLNHCIEIVVLFLQIKCMAIGGAFYKCSVWWKCVK